MQRKAIGAFALAATLAGVSSSANTLTSFSEDFEGFSAGDTPTTGWTIPADAAVVSADQAAGGTQSLSIDTDSEVTFTPTADQVTTVKMDVYLTAGSTAPTWPTDAKLVIYLDNTTLKGSVDGSTWTDIATGVSASTWTSIEMTFSAGSVAVKAGNSAAVTLSNAAVPATVTSVGFSGTGFVDNFVGEYEYNYAYDDSNTDTTGESATADATITVNSGSVSFSYPSVATTGANAMKFVRVYDNTGKYVTLRTTGNSGSIDTSKLSGTISKVVAYYGENVSNVDSGTKTTPESAAVTIDGETPKVSVGVEAKSGVYYSLVDASGNYIQDSEVLAQPDQDGTTITLKAPVSTTAWGAVKFKVKASDTSSASN